MDPYTPKNLFIEMSSGFPNDLPNDHNKPK